MTIENFATDLPDYDALEKRYALLSEATSDLITIGAEPTFKWVRWEDGGGNEGVLVLFPDTKQALLYGYDNESVHNFFGDSEVGEKQVVFNGIPSPYQEALESPALVWSWDDSEKVYATIAFWLDKDKNWTYSEDFAATLDWNYDQGGATYTLKPYIKNEAAIKELLD